MVRERIKELVDFATSESPYRSANKGWITDDVYLQLGSLEGDDFKESDELANVSVFWGPINQILLIVLFVFCFATLLVFTAVPLSQGRLNIPISISSEQQGTKSVEAKNSTVPAMSETKSVEAKNSTVPAMSETKSVEAKNSTVPAMSETKSVEAKNSTVPAMSETKSVEDKAAVRQERLSPSRGSSRVSAGSQNMKKVTTAVDLFQPKHL